MENKNQNNVMTHWEMWFLGSKRFEMQGLCKTGGIRSCKISF